MAGAPAHRLPYLHHGSSPHARGTRRPAEPTGAPGRFIPACAVNASWRLLCQSCLTGHPRIRGERHRAGLAANGCVRFIPACAGNAFCIARARFERPVHPRMRGERCTRHACTCCTYGSSPHARGTPFDKTRECLLRRFIPACAGNAAACSTRAPPRAVHPRMRGERGRLPGDGRAVDGSSPHARGTLMPFDSSSSRNQFIPACAGNAYLTAPKSVAWPVHPRMRGERRSSTRQIFFPDGSSPHARGTQYLVDLGQHHPRFIPACAGNARLPNNRRPISPVHPRMRGERQPIKPENAFWIGSSPHARGTL